MSGTIRYLLNPPSSLNQIMLTIPKNTIIPRPLLKRRLQSAYADALRSGNTSRIISTIGACHWNDVPLSSPNTKKMRLRLAASNLHRRKCIVTIGVPHDTSNTPIASSSSSSQSSSCQRPSSPTLSDNYYNDDVSNVDGSDDGRECWFDANENIESSPSTATDGENDENHPYINNIIVRNEYTTTTPSSDDCEKWKNTVVSCRAKSTKDVVSTMTFSPPLLSDASFESSPTPSMSTPSKVFNGRKMERVTRASSCGKEGPPTIMERREDRSDDEGVHFASPPPVVITTGPKRKMTPAEKREARDKARHWAESSRRRLPQSSTKKAWKKKSRNAKLKLDQKNDCSCNEVRGHGTDDVRSDSIAGRVKSQHRAKIRYITR